MVFPFTNQLLTNFLKKTNMIFYIRKKINEYRLRRFLKKHNKHFEKVKKVKKQFDYLFIETLKRLSNEKK